jgi:hypothetical protein
MTTNAESPELTTLNRYLNQLLLIAKELNALGVAAEIEETLSNFGESRETEEQIAQFFHRSNVSCTALINLLANIKDSKAPLDLNTEKTLKAAQALTKSVQNMLARETQYIYDEIDRLAKESQIDSELFEKINKAAWKNFSQIDWSSVTLSGTSQTNRIDKLNRELALTVKNIVDHEAARLQNNFHQTFTDTINHLYQFATTYDQLLIHVDEQLTVLNQDSPMATIWPAYNPKHLQDDYKATLDSLYSFKHNAFERLPSTEIVPDNNTSDNLQNRLKSAISVIQGGEHDKLDTIFQTTTEPKSTADSPFYSSPFVSKLGFLWQKYVRENTIYTDSEVITNVETAMAVGALTNVFGLNTLFADLLQLKIEADLTLIESPQRQFQTAVLSTIEISLNQNKGQIQQRLDNHIRQQFNSLIYLLDKSVDSLEKWFSAYYQKNLGYDPQHLQQIQLQLENLCNN